MNLRPYRDVLDRALRRRLPADVNLLPRVSAQFTKGWPSARTRSRLSVGIVVVLIALLVTLLALPGVAIALQRLFGYVPSVGYVEQGTPIRVLKEPVSVTRANITVTINSATITSTRTIIGEPIVVGVPDSAYPPKRDGMPLGDGCFPQTDLRLPDGTKMDANESDMPPLPANVNKAVYGMSCIFGTLPGSVPGNWELPLEFVPAPPSLTVVPVTEIVPSPAPNTATVPQEMLTVNKVLEIGNSYILMGEFRSDLVLSTLPAGAQVLGPGSASDFTVTDAHGKEIETSQPQDIAQDLWPVYTHPYASPWNIQVDKGFAAPLTLTFTDDVAIPAGAQARAEFAFDVGEHPQPGHEWLLDQDLDVAGHNIRLVSITVDFHQGYVFRLESDDPAIRSVDLDILGYTPTGWGGGGGGPQTKAWVMNRGLDYEKLPTGKLTLVLSNLFLVGESRTYRLQWSPADTTPIEIVPTPTP